VKWTWFYLYVILDLCRPRDYADPCAA
jgi:hypothetical protein